MISIWVISKATLKRRGPYAKDDSFEIINVVTLKRTIGEGGWYVKSGLPI